MKRLISVIFAMCGIVASLSALDVRDGLVRIKIDELNGRVSFYRLSSVSGSQYEALTFDTDPRTSFLMISIDGRRAKLGDTQDYKMTIRRTTPGAEIEYSSPVVTVKEKISFIRSIDSRVSNGFKIEYEVKNISARDSRVRLRQIWDTRLGEKSGIHFATNLRQRIDEELKFSRQAEETFIATPGENASMALLLSKVERPDYVVLANWKRVSDAAWAYDTLLKGFSMAPYSVNDSAIALYWDETTIRAGATKTFVHYLLSGGPGTEFVKQLTENGFAIAGETVVEDTSAAAKKQLLLDIEAIRKLLASLDQAIEGVGTLKDEEIDALVNQTEEMLAQAGQASK